MEISHQTEVTHLVMLVEEERRHEVLQISLEKKIKIILTFM